MVAYRSAQAILATDAIEVASFEEVLPGVSLSSRDALQFSLNGGSSTVKIALMPTYMPPTMDMRLFWISTVVMPVLLYVAERVARRRSNPRKDRRNAILCAVMGFASAIVLCAPLLRWDSQQPAFGQLLSWFCVHGVIATLLLRISFGVLASRRKSA